MKQTDFLQQCLLSFRFYAICYFFNCFDIKKCVFFFRQQFVEAVVEAYKKARADGYSGYQTDQFVEY